MVNMKEALRVRAEYALWSGRKAVHQPRLKSLQSKYILEQDDVNRLEWSFFSKWKRDYDERLEKEKSEMAEAKAEWEKMAVLMREADERLPELEKIAEEHSEFWGSAETDALHGEEKALLLWCEQMEQAKVIVMETNACINLAKDAMGNTEMLEKSPLPLLQSRAEALHGKVNRFFEEMGMEDRLSSWESMLYYLYSVQSFGSNYGRNSVEDIQLAIATNNALFNLDRELKDLQDRLTQLFSEFEKEGMELLARWGSGESHFCEKEEVVSDTNNKGKKEAFSASSGLFGKIDLSREKERVLFGLELLNKEFEKVIAPVEKTAFGKKLFEKMENVMDAELESINYWEKLLRDWQQDLKQYRKNAGNFPCALDQYEILEKKIWQYTEEDSAELQQTYKEHLRDTAEKLEQAEEQIRTHKR